MGLQKDKEFLEGSLNGFPKIDCLEVMLILMLSHLDVFLFAVESAETRLGDFAVMVCRLRAHHAITIPASIFVDDRQIFIHIPANEVPQQLILLQGYINLLLHSFTLVDSGEGLDLLFRVEADLLVDIKPEGEIVVKDLISSLLWVLHCDF